MLRKMLGVTVISAMLIFVISACTCKTCKQPAQPTPTTETTKKEEVAVVMPKEAKPVIEKEIKSEAPSKCALREFPMIHFAFDRYDLNEEAKKVLTEIAEFLKSCPDVVLLIEGHCDERGSNEYNLALGWKRANEAKKFLVSLGVDPSRIHTVSYGEERPLCYEHNEECWAKNRRDEFVFCVGKCFR